MWKAGECNKENTVVNILSFYRLWYLISVYPYIDSCEALLCCTLLIPFFQVFADPKRPKRSALSKLFEENDSALANQINEILSPREWARKEVQIYRDMPVLLTPLAWYWDLLLKFVTIGDRISQERAYILQERVVIHVFLKNQTGRTNISVRSYY